MPRRAVHRRLKAQVAKAAIATFGNKDFFARYQQLVEHLAGFGIRENRADWYFQCNVIAGSAKHVAAQAIAASFRLMPAREAVIHQSVQVHISNSPHMAAATTVAAIGAAELFVLLVTERHAAITAIASGNIDIRFIYKFHDFFPSLSIPKLCWPKAKPRWCGALAKGRQRIKLQPG